MKIKKKILSAFVFQHYFTCAVMQRWGGFIVLAKKVDKLWQIFFGGAGTLRLVIRHEKTIKSGDAHRLWQAQWGGTPAESVTATDRQSEKLRYGWWEGYRKSNLHKLHARKKARGKKNPHWIHTSGRNNGKITQLLDMMLIYAGEVVKWNEDWGRCSEFQSV